MTQTQSLRGPKTPIDATVVVPGSKSITNRALLCAGLADGSSTLRGPLRSDDTDALSVALQQLGVELAWTLDADGAQKCNVRGNGGRFVAPDFDGPRRFDARLSGTTSRFLLPLLALTGNDEVLNGGEPLRSRPMAQSVQAVIDLGGFAEMIGEQQLPVRVGSKVMRGGSVSVSGSTSSQFLSGLLMAAPLCGDGMRIEVTDELVSGPYVAMTCAVMAKFGIDVINDADSGCFLISHQSYRPADFQIEPDASTASYFFAAAAMTGGKVRVDGLDAKSLQGDVAFVRVLEQMGASVTIGDGFTEVRGTGTLNGVDIDMSEISDTVQTLSAVAGVAHGRTQVRGVGFIRNKETDRLAAVVNELNRCGIAAEETDDGLIIDPAQPRPAQVQTYDDHRMAMSFALLGLRAPGIEILDPDCVEKTFPGYWKAMDKLGALR